MLYPLYHHYFLNIRLSGPQGQSGCSGKQEHLYCCLQLQTSQSSNSQSLCLVIQPHSSSLLYLWRAWTNACLKMN